MSMICLIMSWLPPGLDNKTDTGNFFFPKTPPELGSRLGFGVQGLAGGSLGKFREVNQFGMLFARFL